MKKQLFYCLAIAYSMYAQGQQLPNRYRDETITTIQETKGVIFSNNIPTVKTTNLFGNKLANEDSYGQVTVTLKMDIYRPSGDTLTKRPVIIFAFGGGFVNGTRTKVDIVKLCQAYAKRGFVTATIDYRLGMNVGDQQLSKRAVYRASQDGRSAVRFFRKNAAAYGVDPNQVFIGGHSSGAFLALHSVFLDKDSERPASTRNYLGRIDLGGIESIGDNKTYPDGSLVSGKANGVLSHAGALGELTYIEGPADVPTVYFHSSDDNVVPYNSGEPFSSLSWLPGFNLPTVYGGNQMSIRSASVGAPNTFYPYTNRGHDVHYNGSNLYTDIAPRGSQYFYDTRLKPNDVTITGNTSVCTTCPAQSYSVPKTAFYYDWQVVGGTFVDKNPLNNTVLIQWNSNAVTRKLTVTPYSRQLARGNSVSIDISINLNPVLTRGLEYFSSNKSIDLNDYFTDPEGQELNYKIVSSANEIAKINEFNSISNNLLSINRIAKGNATVSIEVTDGSSCKTTHTIQLKDSEVSEAMNITISPNPFVEKVTLSIESAYQGNVIVQLFDDSGRIITERNLQKEENNVLEESFDSEIKKQGIYYVKIITKYGEVIKRIAKK
ncbi:carboxylesterase family protein [Flavobacterium sp.]|uniref:carboxylesterase family protein n=1 Tax=Flavobacterium sp. TaxID=239 RepID=UPI00286D83BF|nr:carboxylesterase family protein [Flavobacterium sp.]